MLCYNGEPDIGSIIDDDDINAVINELIKFKNPNYNHHHIIENFEEKFKNKILCKYAISVNSCATGLDMVLHALDIMPGDEIISCAINFHGTHLSIINSGAKLILAEADDNLNIDINDLSKKITKRTRAILITHMNGVSCNIDSIKKLIDGTNIKLIEDAARALGSKYNSEYVGKNSWACVFSFQYKKQITTLGEGGMIVTDDESLYQKLLNYRSFGMGRTWGTNYKMTSVQAAMGISQITKLDKIIDLRRQIAKKRNIFIKNNVSNFKLPLDNEIYYNSYYIYTLLTPQNWNKNMRDKLIFDLKIESNINAIIANAPTYLTNEFIRYNCDVSSLEYSEWIGEHIICLPIHPNMSELYNEYLLKRFVETVQKIETMK